MIRHIVKKEEVDSRIDRFLTVFLKDISRSFLTKNLKDFISINGKKVKPSYRLKEGEEIIIDVEGLKARYREELEKSDLESNIIPQKSVLNIIDESENYIVLKKPSGVVVHPGIGHEKDTLANYVKNYLMEKGDYDIELKRGGIVHRLDMPVSGLIVFAKNRKFQKYLSEQFEKHKVLKIYHAYYDVLGGQKVFDVFKKKNLVHTVVKKYEEKKPLDLSDWQEVSGTMKRDPSNRKRMLFERNVENEKLRYAQSYLLPLSEKRMYVLIKTGRMHQIRATLKNLGIVLKGDRLYGYRGEDLNEIGLSSVVLGFENVNGERKVFNILDTVNG